MSTNQTDANCYYMCFAPFTFTLVDYVYVYLKYYFVLPMGK